MKPVLPSLLAILFVISGCTTMSAAEKEQKRRALDIMAGGTITRLLVQYRELESEIENAPGYIVAHINAPAANGGEGVLVVSGSGERRYFTIGKVEVGSGWGTRSFKILLVLNTQEMLDRFKNGTQGSQTATTSEKAPSRNNEYMVYIMSDSGVAVTAAVKIIDFSVNHKLTTM
ncbi:MAG: hypothetical protein ACE5FQ_10405 [Thiogranum sp.]